MDVGSKSVATIFKIIVGTIFIIVISSAIVEFFNVTVTATFVRGIVTKSIEKSCDFFAQETYIRDESGSSLDKPVYNVVPDIKFKDGSVAVSSSFFGSATTQNSIYEKLYGKSNEFKKFINDNGKYWENLRRLGYGIANEFGGNSVLNVNNIGKLEDYDKKAGETYVKTHVTALNSGITYLDRETLGNIARWNMVANFYGGNNDMLHKSSSSVKGANSRDFDYVMYDGYKIYYNTLKITDIDYKVYDLSTVTGAADFARRTNVGNASYWTDTVGIDKDDERKCVCVADVKYSVNISYDGVTPIKRIMQYMISSNNKMRSRSEDVGLIEEYADLDIKTPTYYNENLRGAATEQNDFIYHRNNNSEALASSADYSLLDFNGKVTYYIVR